MTARTIHTLALAIAAAAACYGTGGMAQVPAAVAAPGETTVATFQGEGAQIYQCKAGNDGKLTWVFREPIATLILDDKTVGRHYAGPTWEDANGSAVTGKAIGNAPGATANDIPWLKLDVVNHRGGGTLADVNIFELHFARRAEPHGKYVCHYNGQKIDKLRRAPLPLPAPTIEHSPSEMKKPMARYRRF